MELVAFQAQRFDVVKLEISEFDQVLLSEIEDVPDTTGEFWDEVGGRVANTLKQAVLYLQEEQDFPTFPVIHVVVDALRGHNFMTLMDRHFSLAPVRLWDPVGSADMAPNVQALVSQVSNRSGFTSALGLALRRLGTFGNEGPGILQLSMLPQSATLKKNRQLGVITRTMFAMWAVTFLVMAAWTGGLVMPSFLQSQADSRGFEGIKAEAEASQSRIGQINEAVTQLDATLATLDTVSRQRGKAYIIETLPDLVPEGMEMSDYLLTNGTDLLLKGAANSPDVVQLFVSELQNSGLVEQPALSEPTLREGSNIYEFEIATKLRQEN
jgi:Tfp pilus assembly protein PilN